MNIAFLLQLRKEFTLLLICVFVSAALVIISIIQLNATSHATSQAKKILVQAKKKHYTSAYNKNIFNEYEIQYIALHNQGFFNHAARFNWLDSLNRISREINIPSLTYKLHKQKELTSPQLKKLYPGVQIYVSTMTLNLQLLHEGDLYSVLNSLDTSDIGLFNVRKCTLIRNKKHQPPSVANPDFQYNISSICEIDWFTLQTENTYPS